MNREKLKEILIVICVSYTVISLGVALFETIEAGQDRNFLDNVTKLLWTTIAVCILYTHPMLERLSPLLMILLQYAAAQGLVLLSIWLGGHVEELAPTAYQDGFRSFTVIYAIGAAAYYIGVKWDVRKNNELLQEIRAVRK